MPTVLIVEDEPLVREVAAFEFEDAGYRVLEAEDGDSALALLSGSDVIDLLFTDIRLPGEIDGWTIAARARDLHPELPIIYATGYPGETVRPVANSRFIRKPYLPTAIIATARALGVGD